MAKHDFAIERKGLKHEVESLLVFADPGPGNDTMLLVKEIASVAVEEDQGGQRLSAIEVLARDFDLGPSEHPLNGAQYDELFRSSSLTNAQHKALKDLLVVDDDRVGVAEKRFHAEQVLARRGLRQAGAHAGEGIAHVLNGRGT